MKGKFKMLVLTRKIGESIILKIDGRETAIKVLEIRGKQASIGIDAPEDIRISRVKDFAGTKVQGHINKQLAI
jgi:carbon storage regulator CsrA